MTVGVYLLRFPNTSKVYIGKSTRIETRFVQHKNALQKSKHSVKMMEAYKKYGMPSLEILHIAEEDRLTDLEEVCIVQYNSLYEGFNSTYASIGVGTRNEFSTVKATYDKDQIISVFKFLIETQPLPHKIIADICGVSKDIVSAISCTACHRWLEREFPEEYLVLVSKVGNKYSYSKSAESQGIEYPLIQSPLGITYNVINTCAFAREHGLDQPHLHKVLKQQRLSHKGWKLLNPRKKDKHMSWTDEAKAEVIAKYLAGNPTPSNSTELITAIAEEMSQSPNGVRMILVGSGDYVKKDATADGGKTKAKAPAKDGDKAPRVSKEDQIAELAAAIEANGKEVDQEILSKLTGKAAAYFTKVLAA